MAFKVCPLLALCVVLSALAGAVVAHDKIAAGAATFAIEGRVYCDTCRAGFETTVTEYIAGAKVRLQCRHEDSDKITHTVDGVTDATGTYKLQAFDDHQNEICQVILVESPNPECAEIKVGRDRANIVLTHNSGMSTNVRYANSLGFLKVKPLPECGKVLMQYHLGDEEY